MRGVLRFGVALVLSAFAMIPMAGAATALPKATAGHRSPAAEQFVTEVLTILGGRERLRQEPTEMLPLIPELRMRADRLLAKDDPVRQHVMAIINLAATELHLIAAGSYGGYAGTAGRQPNDGPEAKHHLEDAVSTLRSGHPNDMELRTFHAVQQDLPSWKLPDELHPGFQAAKRAIKNHDVDAAAGHVWKMRTAVAGRLRACASGRAIPHR